MPIHLRPKLLVSIRTGWDEFGTKGGDVRGACEETARSRAARTCENRVKSQATVLGTSSMGRATEMAQQKGRTGSRCVFRSWVPRRFFIGFVGNHLPENLGDYRCRSGLGSCLTLFAGGGLRCCAGVRGWPQIMIPGG